MDTTDYHRFSKQYQTAITRWWFVVTQSAYAKSFQRYGDVLTRNQIESWIHTTFSPPPLNTTRFHHTQQRAGA
jgi:hypothetical protein